MITAAQPTARLSTNHATMPKELTDKKITLENLAQMIQRGFEETAKKADVDKQFAVLRNDIKDVRDLLTSDYKRRVETLEKDVKELKEALAM
jgi:hypothetical protein